MLTYLFIAPKCRLAFLGETQFIDSNEFGFVFSFIDFDSAHMAIEKLPGINKRYRIHKDNADFYLNDQLLFKFQGELWIFESIDEALKKEFCPRSLGFHIKEESV